MPWFQTWVAQKATAYLSKELNTRVEVKGVSIKFIKSVVLEGVYIEDLQKDTILYTQKLTIDLNKLDIARGKYSVQNLAIEKGRFNYKELKNGSTNLSFIINYFSSGKAAPKDTAGKPIKILVGNVKITDFTFAYKDESDTSKTEGMNYADIVASHIFLDAKEVSIDDNFILADLKNLSAREQCGFVLNKLAGNVKYSPKEIEINKLQLITPNSNIGNYLAFRFKKISDFNHFVSKVYMDGHFKKSRVNFKDISFFAPAIKNYTLDVKLDGKIKGTVTDLKARGLDIYTGEKTHIKGDFSIKGLPEINSTQMDMTFEQLNTNNEEVNNVFRSIDLKDVQLPELLNKLGDIDFKGTFNGKYNDFAVKGDIKSAIGTAVTDLSMNLKNMKKPFYKGKVDVSDLNLGIITDEKLLGKTTFTATVDGQGFGLEQLYQNLSSKVDYFEYNGYRYSNINIDGVIDRKKINVKLSVNDKNLALDFKSNINLNGVKTQGDLYADIKKANLRELYLMKDSLKVSTAITSNFSGNSIDNLLGNVLLENTQLSIGTETYKIDTIDLNSKIVNDTTSEISFKSDFAVVGISGKYKVSEIPAALKNLLRSYLPAYKWGKAVKTSPQKFTFEIGILDINPLTSIFIPDLNIPEKGSIIGSFDSEQRSLTTSGLIRKLNYQKIKLDNLIIDQGNSEQSLFLNLAVNKLSKDSLIFDNVAVSNFILDNNINSNIKLADPKGANSLDLNSRLVVKTDSTVFSILPSELKLDNQVWKIDNSFRILFGNEQFYIDHFTIRNGEQELEVEGAISKTDDEPLVINLRNLNLKTFNPLIKGRGIELDGYITGNASTSSVLKAPKVTSDLMINNLMLNNSELGDAELSSRWYSETNEVNFSMNVVNKGTPTISLSGALQPSKAEDNLFIDAELNETNLSIFQPFLTGLVSNLKGTTSANVLVKGSVKKPIINGSIAFNNAGVRVDYLNTTYSFNDKIAIENGKIAFNRFILNDVNGNTARANGSMDLSNLIDPTLDIRINATNFQALNTTSKDNSLYYGTANVATGNFRFKGPLSNMQIDIKATTGAGTKFFLPISNEGSTGDEGLVEFVSKDTTKTSIKKENNFSNLTLTFELTVTDAAEAQIIFDENTGEVIRGKGNANLQLRINSLGQFEIFGLYNITEGEYNFNYENIITRPFKIMPGSTVRFTGDPYDALLNVKAYYQTRTSVTPLFQDAGLTTDDAQAQKTVQVNTVITIKNTLSSMDYDFNIEFPQETSLKENYFSSYFTPDNSQKQAISLLATNNFMSGRIVGNGAAYELASSTLSGFVNKFIGSNNFDINAKIGGTGSTEVGTNVRLLNNRLIINGSFVTVDPSTTNVNTTKTSSTVTSDIDVEYLLSKDGNLRIAAYNHSNALHSTDLTYENDYKQGLGLRYKKEFDSWKEFFQSFKRQKQIEEDERKKRQEERQKQQQNKTENSKQKKEDKPIDLLPDNADELIK
ncbi:translocation/assembly module TamB domain-containing protein [Solitalea koreensis]|uniref:Translocation and assembly module TamB C-terminal domain-containing protein n=1 Tax=Solitalea koreensis TaxID=543615 RepID=A0A521EL58_9SPHI|nr:translocation/assembly module TamB domain-containing protein [Solitalea koreensis]SMO84647.1 Family of unknown function [Solitalea koreensis]